MIGNRNSYMDRNVQAKKGKVGYIYFLENL